MPPLAPLFARVIAAALEDIGITYDELVTRTHRHPEASYRWAVWAALLQVGASKAMIGRWFHMNHATIVHGLERFAEDPYWVARAKLYATGGLHGAAQITLWRCTSIEAEAITSYLEALVYGRRGGMAAARGLCLLASSPQLYNRARMALNLADLDQHIYRMSAQAAQHGAEWLQHREVPA